MSDTKGMVLGSRLCGESHHHTPKPLFPFLSLGGLQPNHFLFPFNEKEEKGLSGVIEFFPIQIKSY